MKIVISLDFNNNISLAICYRFKICGDIIEIFFNHFYHAKHFQLYMKWFSKDINYTDHV